MTPSLVKFIKPKIFSVHVHVAKMARHLSSFRCGKQYYICTPSHAVVLLRHVLFVTFSPRQYIFIIGSVVTEGPVLLRDALVQ